MSRLCVREEITCFALYKRRDTCFALISSQSCVNRLELRACCLVQLIILITSCVTLCLSDIFQVPSISLRIILCRHTQKEPLWQSSETRKQTSHGSFSVCAYTNTKWPILFSWYVVKNVSSSASVLLAGSRSAHNTSSCLVNKGRLVNLDCVPSWLINPNCCASVSSAVSSVCLVTVLAKRGICGTFWTAASKSSRPVSLEAGRINCSLTIKGF